MDPLCNGLDGPASIAPVGKQNAHPTEPDDHDENVDSLQALQLRFTVKYASILAHPIVYRA